MLIATSMVGFLLWRSERGPEFNNCVIPCVDSLIRRIFRDREAPRAKNSSRRMDWPWTRPFLRAIAVRQLYQSLSCKLVRTYADDGKGKLPNF